MESHIKIKATVPEMNALFEKDGGIRWMEIKDKRYSEAELNIMPDAKFNSEKFTWTVIYRHKELDKPLTGTFTIAGLMKRLDKAPITEGAKRPSPAPSVLEKLKTPCVPGKQGIKKSHELEDR